LENVKVVAIERQATAKQAFAENVVRKIFIFYHCIIPSIMRVNEYKGERWDNRRTTKQAFDLPNERLA
jgi:hypothetical protein